LSTLNGLPLIFFRFPVEFFPLFSISLKNHLTPCISLATIRPPIVRPKRIIHKHSILAAPLLPSPFAQTFSPLLLTNLLKKLSPGSFIPASNKRFGKATNELFLLGLKNNFLRGFPSFWSFYLGFLSRLLLASPFAARKSNRGLRYVLFFDTPIGLPQTCHNGTLLPPRPPLPLVYSALSYRFVPRYVPFKKKQASVFLSLFTLFYRDLETPVPQFLSFLLSRVFWEDQASVSLTLRFLPFLFSFIIFIMTPQYRGMYALNDAAPLLFPDFQRLLSRKTLSSIRHSDLFLFVSSATSGINREHCALHFRDTVSFEPLSLSLSLFPIAPINFTFT